MTKSTHHSFCVDLAEKYGIIGAILIHHFQHWINHNKSLDRNEKDGRTWTYQTRKEIAAWFGYLSEDQVRRETDKLVEEGVLIKGNYNKSALDKTIWYAFVNEKMFTKGKSANSTGKSANSSLYTDTKRKHVSSLDMESEENPGANDEQSEQPHTKKKKRERIPQQQEVKGRLKEQVSALSTAERKTYDALMEVEPASIDDEHFNPVIAHRCAKSRTFQQVSDAISVYRQRLLTGKPPRSMGGALMAIIESGVKPQGPSFEENIKFWEETQQYFPVGSFKRTSGGVTLPEGAEADFSMTQEVFQDIVMGEVFS